MTKLATYRVIEQAHNLTFDILYGLGMSLTKLNWWIHMLVWLCRICDNGKHRSRILSPSQQWLWNCAST